MTKTPNPYLTIRLPEDEKAILDAYCYDTRQTKTDVLRQFIRSLLPGEKTSVGSEEQKFLRSMSSTKPGTGVYFVEEHYRPKALHSDQEVREWLQSLGAEADQELADAASLRAMAAHMLTIAERLEK